MAASTKTKKAAKKKVSTSPKFKTVQEYIASLPPVAKAVVKELRQTIKQVAPTAEDMISYNMPAFKLDDKGLIWYAAWKEHVSIYPRTRVMEEAIKELANYEGAKGTIKFPLDKPMPFAMIQKIIKLRMLEIKNPK
jgi:uncharacterized protein YdhG (YjbR/CyaY superfamily)